MNYDSQGMEQRIASFAAVLDEALLGHLRKALQYVDSDPYASLHRSRLVLEKVLVAQYGEKMKREPKKAMLGDLLNDNQFTREIERRIISRMHSVRDMGNLGTHGDTVFDMDAGRALSDLCDILEWRYGVQCRDAGTDIRDLAPAREKPGQSLVSSYGACHAVVVGVNRYPRLKDNQQLTFAVPDAEAIAEKLLPRFGFTKDRIVILTDADATRSGIEQAFCATLAGRVKEQDAVLFFFAGHGGLREPVKQGVTEQAFLLPCDADEQQLTTTAIPMRWLADWADAVPARHVLFILDCCYSGFAALRSPARDIGLPGYLGHSAHQVMTAGKSGQQVTEKDGFGLFTRHLLAGLGERRAERDGRGYITATDLWAYVESRVSADSDRARMRHDPCLMTLRGEGNFVFFPSQNDTPSDAAADDGIDIPQIPLQDGVERLFRLPDDLRTAWGPARDEDDLALTIRSISGSDRRILQWAPAKTPNAPLDYAILESPAARKRFVGITAKSFVPDEGPVAVYLRIRCQGGQERWLGYNPRLNERGPYGDELSIPLLPDPDRKPWHTVLFDPQDDLELAGSDLQFEALIGLRFRGKAEIADILVADDPALLAASAHRPRKTTPTTGCSVYRLPGCLVPLLPDPSTLPLTPESGQQRDAAAAVGMPTAAETTTGLPFRFIPAGRFSMGNDSAHAREAPAHDRVITDAFWMMSTPMTRGQFAAVQGDHPPANPELPVTEISWQDADEFCKGLNQRETDAGRLPDGWAFRLPTEAEWEYACKGGMQESLNDISELAWHEQNTDGTVQPVSTKPPNAWGLSDLLGNVWEWCLDVYAPYAGASYVDERAIPEQNRVLRGGSVADPASSCRPTARNWCAPDYRSKTVGFRIVLAPKQRCDQRIDQGMFYLREPVMLDHDQVKALKPSLTVDSSFLDCPRGTLCFKALVTEAHLDAPSNRYLFAHTSDARDVKGHPDSFSLCAFGTSKQWRLSVFRRPHPPLHLYLPFEKDMLGWRVFTVRWDRERGRIELDLDHGRWRVHTEIVGENWPRPANCLLRIGHYPSLYKGCEANTKMHGFRLMPGWITDDKLRVISRPEIALTGCIVSDDAEVSRRKPRLYVEIGKGISAQEVAHSVIILYNQSWKRLKSWTPAVCGERIASFPDLNPGTYHVELYICGLFVHHYPNVVVGSVPKSLTFTQVPRRDLTLILHDEKDQPVASAPCELHLGPITVGRGTTDEEGRIAFSGLLVTDVSPRNDVAYRLSFEGERKRVVAFGVAKAWPPKGHEVRMSDKLKGDPLDVLSEPETVEGFRVLNDPETQDALRKLAEEARRREGGDTDGLP